MKNDPVNPGVSPQNTAQKCISETMASDTPQATDPIEEAYEDALVQGLCKLGAMEIATRARQTNKKIRT